ncbi:hypothetical protein V2I01_13815 [Micromonospora sp. BRA006-A]|nr:hypothetical protein [Micromonospora sp. BRA006-A]
MLDIAAVDGLAHEIQRIVDSLLARIPESAASCCTVDAAREVAAPLGFNKAEVIYRQERLPDLTLGSERERASDLTADAERCGPGQPAVLGDHLNTPFERLLDLAKFLGRKEVDVFGMIDDLVTVVAQEE